MEEVFLTMMGIIVPFAGIVFGLVEFVKAVFELKGKAVTAVSFGIGVFFGAVAYVSYLFPAWAPHIAGVMTILTVGLVASGFYKFADARWPKQ